jgi:rRNA maturation protein Rpf1
MSDHFDLPARFPLFEIVSVPSDLLQDTIPEKNIQLVEIENLIRKSPPIKKICYLLSKIFNFHRDFPLDNKTSAKEWNYFFVEQTTLIFARRAWKENKKEPLFLFRTLLSAISRRFRFGGYFSIGLKYFIKVGRNLTENAKYRPKVGCHFMEDLKPLSKIGRHFTEGSKHINKVGRHFTGGSKHINKVGRHFTGGLKHINKVGRHFTGGSKHINKVVFRFTSDLKHITKVGFHFMSDLKHITKVGFHFMRDLKHIIKVGFHFMSDLRHISKVIFRFMGDLKCLRKTSCAFSMITTSVYGQSEWGNTLFLYGNKFIG